ncbi:MAG: hypothetical protein ACI4PF_04085 [Christensenellales bacterium]
MKIAIIGLNSNLIKSKEQEKIINYLKNRLYEMGENVSLISYFDNNFDSLRNIISQKFDVLFVIGNDQTIYNYNIKENLSRIFGDKLENNNACFNALKKYCNECNINFSVQEEMEGKVPSKSIPLCNEKFLNNGFMYKYLEQYIIFLPSNYDFATMNYNNYILPLLIDISKNNLECLIIRCYGILERDIRNLISEELMNSDINIQIINERLDNKIYIRYDINKVKNIQNILSTICSKLNKFIYSMEDTNLYQTAKYLLNLHKKQLVVAETITLGNITKNLCCLDNSLISDAFIFNNFENIIKQLNLDSRVVDKYGKYSVNTIYELDNLLLEQSNAQIAIFVLGDITLDTCYIAIGDFEGIHVYKNKILTSDENLIDNISDTALFYLIKKLRQNDLQFR